jgi:hypothetical protein
MGLSSWASTLRASSMAVLRRTFIMATCYIKVAMLMVLFMVREYGILRMVRYYTRVSSVEINSVVRGKSSMKTALFSKVNGVKTVKSRVSSQMQLKVISAFTKNMMQTVTSVME